MINEGRAKREKSRVRCCHIPGMILSCGGYPKISVPISSRIATIPTRCIFMITFDPSCPDHRSIFTSIRRRLARTRERQKAGCAAINSNWSRVSRCARELVCGIVQVVKSKPKFVCPYDMPAELLSLSDCAVVWRAVWRFHWLYTCA